MDCALIPSQVRAHQGGGPRQGKGAVARLPKDNLPRIKRRETEKARLPHGSQTV